MDQLIVVLGWIAFLLICGFFIFICIVGLALIIERIKKLEATLNFKNQRIELLESRLSKIEDKVWKDEKNGTTD